MSMFISISIQLLNIRVTIRVFDSYFFFFELLCYGLNEVGLCELLTRSDPMKLQIHMLSIQQAHLNNNVTMHSNWALYPEMHAMYALVWEIENANQINHIKPIDCGIKAWSLK